MRAHPPEIPAYRTKRVAGTGAMGEVWHAEHVRTGIPVAIKRLPTPSDARVLAFHDAEVRATAALDHPNIVRIVDIGTLPDDGRWLALEWCDGGTLHGIDTFGALENVTRQLLAALAHAHARGVVHRDVKPGNILRDRLGTWKLADFGVARIDTTVVDRIVGSPAYIAPEVLTRAARTHGPAIDLYSLGCTLWEQATGRPPFTGLPLQILEQHRTADLPPFRPTFPVPEGYATWLRTLLRKRPSARPRGAAVALHALDEALGRPRTRQIPREHPLPEAPGRDVRLRDAGAALLPFREPRLFGRRGLLDRLWAVFADTVEAGQPRVVVLTGPEDVGRSRLACAFGRSVVEGGWGSTVQLQVGHSGLAAVQEAFGGLSRESFEHWRSDQPAVIVLDDLADPPSARALADVIVRAGGPMLWLVTANDLPEQLRKRLPPGDLLHLPVPELTDGAIGQLLRETLSLEPELHSTLARSAGGRPGRALRQLQRWSPHLRPTSAGFVLAPTATDAEVSDTLREVLTPIALCGGSLALGPWEVACADAGVPLDWRAVFELTATEDLRVDMLEDRIVLGAGLVTAWLADVQAHRGLCGALLQTLPPSHAGRGLLLEAVGREEEAIEVLLTTARDHRRVGDRGRALEDTRQARRIAEARADHERTWESRLLQTQLWIDTWQVERTLKALGDWAPALRSAPLDARVEALVRRGTAYRYLGQHHDAVAVLREAAASADALPPNVASRVLNAVASQFISMGRGDEALDLARRSLTLAEDDERRAFSALTLGRLHAWRHEDQQGLAILERGLRWARTAGRPITEVNLLSMLGEARSRMGDLDEAGRLLAEAVELGRQSPNFDAVMLEINVLCNALRLEQFAETLATAEHLARDPRVRRLTIAKVGVALLRTVASAGVQRWNVFVDAADSFLGYLDKYPRLSDPDFAAFARQCRALVHHGPAEVIDLADELVERTAGSP